jgi:cation diffusion facilitator CzcD-associated flavoprotein CzcO
MFPTRDHLIEHVDGHARDAGVDLSFNTEVTRIDRRNGGWRLQTPGGDVETRHVVLATGLMHTPSIPDWPGGGDFGGGLLHSSAYRNPAPYAGKQVLVIGSGSSGMEIAHDLAGGGAAKVWMAVRTPPNIMLRGGPGGLPGEVIALPLFHAPTRLGDALALKARRRIIGDLSEFGLPIPDEGPFTRLERYGAVPSLVDIEVIDAIRDGSIEVVAGVEGADRGGVRLLDGRRLTPDVAICATGYHNGLAPMVGHLDVLDERGEPRGSWDRPAIPGLWFIGFSRRPALIGYMGKQSRRIAKTIANS